MATELRPFEERDWEAFPDCRSDAPLVAYTEKTAIVLDGAAVLIFVTTDEKLVLGERLAFASAAQARAVAERLAHGNRENP